jgi:hypothetical protein
VNKIHLTNAGIFQALKEPQTELILHHLKHPTWWMSQRAENSVNWAPLGVHFLPISGLGLPDPYWGVGSLGAVSHASWMVRDMFKFWSLQRIDRLRGKVPSPTHLGHP